MGGGFEVDINRPPTRGMRSNYRKKQSRPGEEGFAKGIIIYLPSPTPLLFPSSSCKTPYVELMSNLQETGFGGKVYTIFGILIPSSGRLVLRTWGS